MLTLRQLHDLNRAEELKTILSDKHAGHNFLEN